MWVYCKTIDNPKFVGQYICDSNFCKEIENQVSSVLKHDDEDDCWLIKTNPKLETSAIIYRIGKEIVVTEIDDECAINVIEPLMKKYGFESVKWLAIN